MREKKRKIKVPLTGQIRLPEALDREIDVECSVQGKFKYEVIADAWEAYKAAKAGGSKGPSEIGTESATPPSASVTDPVLDLVRTHAQDPSYIECLVALERIWNVGDIEFKEAITSNCRAFVRASDAIGNLGDNTGPGPETETSSYAERVGKLLATAEAIDARTLSVKKAFADSGGSGTGVAEVGRRITRKSKGGS